jgi:hypothetical protein
MRPMVFLALYRADNHYLFWFIPNWRGGANYGDSRLEAINCLNSQAGLWAGKLRSGCQSSSGATQKKRWMKETQT